MDNIDFADATKKLVDINSKLNAVDLLLVLDYKYNIKKNENVYSFSKDDKALTLCLIKKVGKDTCNNNSPDSKQQCVSSIELKIIADEDSDPPKIICEISSKTKPQCEGRRYNTFLRSVLIFIANAITLENKNVTTILSTPINSISIWLLVSSYYTNNKYGKNMGSKYIEEQKSFSPADFKGIKSINIFNNVKAKTNSTKKNNKSNVIPSKLNNKNTKKNAHRVILSQIMNNKSLNTFQLKKSIVESITEIEIDIGSETTHGNDNIEIAEAKINEFIDELIEAKLNKEKAIITA